MIDKRVGRQDYFTRYKIYSHDFNIKNSLDIEKECKGILHAKDITPYTKQMTINKYSQTHVSAQIESYDVVTLAIGDKLYSIDEDKWYRVEQIQEDSYTPSQMRSRRPIIRKVFTITVNE